ncbi:MAG: hypothetical protein PUP46_08235 [Endozoicomonas sp. (ex Botrylloides leachii)]|nr:hypothetical protein [Endozoicomonas sp. (ex Botrylloides leachii)]
MKLLAILFGLGLMLIVLVNIAERYGNPMGFDQQRRLSRWVIVLVFASIIIQIIHHLMRG